MTQFKTALLGLGATALIGAAGFAFAQQPMPEGGGPGGRGPGAGERPMMERMHERMEHWRHGGGMGMGMGMAGPMGHICQTRDDAAKPMIDGLERAIQPRPDQKTEMDALRTAATKAQETLRSACPSEAERGDHTPPARLAMAEKHATAMAEALHIVRPPFDALYAKLDDKQRDRMRWMGPLFGPAPR
jgi:hypothetical protein